MPDANIIIALIAATAPTIAATAAFVAALLAKKAAVSTELKVDGRMTELLALAKAEAKATATLKEKNAQQQHEVDQHNTEKTKNAMSYATNRKRHRGVKR